MSSYQQSIPLALDFDGVLCDSTEECVVVAWNGWLALNKTNRFVRTPAEVPQDIADHIRAFRCYVKTPGEYLPIIQTGVNQQPVSSQADYERLLEEYAPDIPSFSTLLLEARNTLRQENLSDWINLHRTYEGVLDGVKRLAADFELFIVTGKDKPTVEQFLASLGLDVIATDRIFDKEAARNKLEMLTYIAEVCRVPLTSVFMLDDNVVHLLPPQQAGCQVFLAEWGYHTEEHLQVAQVNRIPVVGLHNWSEVLHRRRDAL